MLLIHFSVIIGDCTSPLSSFLVRTLEWSLSSCDLWRWHFKGSWDCCSSCLKKSWRIFWGVVGNEGYKQAAVKYLTWFPPCSLGCWQKHLEVAHVEHMSPPHPERHITTTSCTIWNLLSFLQWDSLKGEEIYGAKCLASACFQCTKTCYHYFFQDGFLVAWLGDGWSYCAHRDGSSAVWSQRERAVNLVEVYLSQDPT